MSRLRFTACLGALAAGLGVPVVGCGTNEDASGQGGPGVLDGGSGGRSSFGGRTGSGGRSGADDSGTGTLPGVGKTCLSDNDCESGLVCLSGDGDEFGGEGPANGVCSKACKQGEGCGDDALVCLLFTDTDGFCVE